MTRSRTGKRYTSLDLFAGAGGISLGIEDAGFLSVGTIEIDPVASQTLETNFGHQPADFHGPVEGDIRAISTRRIKARLRKAGFGSLDFLVAAPPCQGFSRVGRGKLDSMKAKRGSFAVDDRNDLYKHAIRVLKALRPRAFFFENVTGILHLRGRNVAEDVCDTVAAAGYRVRCTLLNTAWYGVPQARERVIILGLRKDLGIEPVFPRKRFHTEHFHGALSNAELNQRFWRNPDYFVDPRTIPCAALRRKAVSVREAFDDLPTFKEHLARQDAGQKYKAMRNLFEPVNYSHSPNNLYCMKMRAWNDSLVSPNVTDHFCRWTPRDFETFALMKPGDRYPEAVRLAEGRFQNALTRFRIFGGKRPRRRDYVPPYDLENFEDKWRKLIPAQPSWTITAHLAQDTYSHIHFDPRQARAITIREAARLQSFPDAFRFVGNTGDTYRQIGNAVPPLLAKEIGEAIFSQLVAFDRGGRPGR